MGVNKLKLYNANNLNKNKNITTFMGVNKLNGELNKNQMLSCGKKITK